MKSSFHSLFRLGLILGSASHLPGAEPASGSSPLEISPGYLDTLVSEATRQNPALQAAGARSRAAESALGAVRTWEDPTASFGLWMPGSGGIQSSQQGNLVYGVDQKLPLHDRPDLMRKVAAADATRAQLAAGSELTKLRRDLALALNGLALADRSAEVARQDLAWIDATREEVDHRYRVGRASQVDWLKIETDRASAAEVLITKEEEREHGAFSLNRLLNRDLHAPWPQLAIPSLQVPLHYTPALVNAVLEAQPDLQIMREESASAQAAADLTRTSRLPDVSVGLQAWQYSGDGAIKQGMATVSFSLPWLNRKSYDSEWRRDKERKRAADLAAEDYALSVRETLHHHLVDLDAARRQVLLYRDQLVPLTEQTLASARSAWEHNLGSFQDILEAHRMLLADELGLAQALTDQANMVAEICFLTHSRDASAVVALAGSPTPDHAAHLSIPAP